MPSLVDKVAGPAQTKIVHSHLPKDGSKPHQWILAPPAGQPWTNMQDVEYDVSIQDLRDPSIKSDNFGLDKSGFDSLTEPTSMTYQDWSNEETIQSKYYQEVIDMLKRYTGAHKSASFQAKSQKQVLITYRRVTIFDHTIRRNDFTTEDTPSSRKPVYRAHVDQTTSSTVKRVHRHDPDTAEELLKGRVRLINVWRPLRGPVKDIPLAVADYRSLDTKKDVVPTDLIYTPEQIGETLTVLYNPSQKWYYLSDMQPSEALLLKCFDSLSTTENPKEGIASLAPHTAFQDARYVGKSGIEPRESIEIRALVYSSA